MKRTPFTMAMIGAVSLAVMGGIAEAKDLTRAKAIRECSIEAQKLVDYVWGVIEIEHYRACMAKRGQIE